MDDPGGNNGPRPRDPEYWCAYLAASIGGALVTKPYDLSRPVLERALRDFTRSRNCTTELRDIIHDIQKGRR